VEDFNENGGNNQILVSKSGGNVQFYKPKEVWKAV
jgi:hypothetical protein